MWKKLCFSRAKLRQVAFKNAESLTFFSCITLLQFKGFGGVWRKTKFACHEMVKNSQNPSLKMKKRRGEGIFRDLYALKNLVAITCLNVYVKNGR